MPHLKQREHEDWVPKIILLVTGSIRGLSVFRLTERLGKDLRRLVRICDRYLQFCKGYDLLACFKDCARIAMVKSDNYFHRGSGSCLYGDWCFPILRPQTGRGLKTAPGRTVGYASIAALTAYR
uniref:Uncharacterized protein n=1 Tax=mine drainage metagenome TaxID=410659 RepID=E6QUW0_9ZZZZ